MQSLAALFLVFVAVAHAEQSLLSYVPENYHVYLNKQAKSDLSKLNMKDVHALKAVALKAPQFTSVAQLRQAVQKASPQATMLATKYSMLAAATATSHYNQFKSKLAPKSQQMFGELAGLASTAARNFASQAHKIYQKQDPSTKANLAQAFSYATAASKTPAGKVLMAHFSQ